MPKIVKTILDTLGEIFLFILAFVLLIFAWIISLP